MNFVAKDILESRHAHILSLIIRINPRKNYFSSLFITTYYCGLIGRQKKIFLEVKININKIRNASNYE